MSEHDAERPTGRGRADRGLRNTELPGAEGYLEAIFVLTTESGRARAARVAEYLGVSPVSVSKSLSRLEAAGVVEKRNPFIELTPEGWREAALVVRRHRLVERWLADRLGLGLIDAHREAERLEHAFSNTVTEALWEEMGRPGTCPHGNPIPDVTGAIPSVARAVALRDAPSAMVRVDRLYEQLEGLETMLGWAEAHGLVPGHEVETRRDRDSVYVREATDGSWVKVPPEVAERVLVLDA
ncbi:MAG: metal-dependent transcriptional regulator [Clostridia bacterium]